MAGCQSDTASEKTGPLTEGFLVGSTWTLDQAVTYSISEDGNSVTEVIVDTEELEGDFTLSFDETFLGGEAGCKTFRGNWFLDEFGRLSLSGLLSTTENCTQADPTFENVYLAAIQNVTFAELNAAVLEIKSPQNGSLFFTKK